MTGNDAVGFARLMKGLSVVFDKELPDGLTDIYFRALSEFDFKAVERAVERAITGCKFFPKPAELRELIVGSPEDQGSIAWETAMTAFRKAGYWNSVVFEDGGIGQAIVTVFGGWVGFSEAVHILSDEMIRAKQKEFFIAYRNAKRMNKSHSYLPGHHESENRNTIGTWKRGNLPPVYKQNVFVSGLNEARFVSASFERATGHMVGRVEELLSLPAVRVALPPVPKALLSESTEHLSPEEGAEFFKQAVGVLAERMAMPSGDRRPMTPAETRDRIRELRDQAAMLEDVITQ
jgi:hypothetical protein